jgi:hypothetical protein
MKQLRTVAAISAITLITAPPTFADQQRDTQGQTGVKGNQTTTERAAAGQTRHDARRIVAAEKGEHQALVARVKAA